MTLLTSMLLPALKKARDVARGVECSGNLKQFGVALSQYGVDYDGWAIPCDAGPDYPSCYPWITLAAPYLNIRVEATNIATRFAPAKQPPYVCRADGAELDRYENGIYSNYAWNQYLGYRDYGGSIAPKKLSNCRAPSKASVMADSQKTFIFYAGGTAVSLETNYLRRRHPGKKCNATHADGHVEGVDYASLDALQVGQWGCYGWWNGDKWIIWK